MSFSRFNVLDPSIDIAGSIAPVSNLILSDELAGLGAALSGQTGSAASITTFTGGVATVAGLTGMTTSSVGNFLTVLGAASGGNNGTFLIISRISATSVTVSNATGVASDANNGAIIWSERGPYSLETDINFARTDRAAIKGVAYSASIPTYQRPTAIGTSIPADLSNIAGKTTDARGFINNRKFNDVTVAATDTAVTLSSVGNLRHADSTDKTGVPCFDASPYTGDYSACYVEIVDNAGQQILSSTGNKVFGLTFANATSSPDAVDVKFYSVALGADIAGGTAYTWETGKPTTVDMFYGYFMRLDQMPEDAFRAIQSLGIEENGGLRQDITDLQSVVGMTDGDTFLAGLTNTTANFPFFTLPDGTPSVTEALNTLNAQIGNLTYTGAYLTDGQTIAASLQALSNAVSGASNVRYIERLSADLPAFTTHTLPGGASYTLDITGNGRNLWVFSRGVLRDPGTVATGDEYEETSSTSITFYFKHRSTDHINYVVYA